MSKISPKTLLNKNTKKEFDIKEISLDNISMDDLKEDSKNYVILKSLLNSVSSCQLSDAYNTIARRSGVIESIKPINNQKVYGKITTCETQSDDWGTVTLAIDEAERGDVLFIKCNNMDMAVWGELASTAAKAQDIKATIIYGCARDLDALLYMDYPVFAVDFRPNAGKPLGLGNVNVELSVEDMDIMPGDFFFGDETGIVIIPNTLFNDVIKQTLEIKKTESNIVDMLNDGLTLSQITNLK